MTSMLKTSIYLFIILFCALSACRDAQRQEASQGEWTVSESTDSSATAKIEFPEKAHDFGDFTSGEIVTHTFRFKNTGNKSLLIKRVETSCGCLTATHDPKPIPPGEEGSIEVEFDTKGLVGKQYKIITIFANIPGKATEVRVLANIKY